MSIQQTVQCTNNIHTCDCSTCNNAKTELYVQLYALDTVSEAQTLFNTLQVNSSNTTNQLITDTIKQRSKVYNMLCNTDYTDLTQQFNDTMKQSLHNIQRQQSNDTIQHIIDTLTGTEYVGPMYKRWDNMIETETCYVHSVINAVGTFSEELKQLMFDGAYKTTHKQHNRFIQLINNHTCTREYCVRYIDWYDIESDDYQLLCNSLDSMEAVIDYERLPILIKYKLRQYIESKLNDRIQQLQHDIQLDNKNITCNDLTRLYHAPPPYNIQKLGSKRKRLKTLQDNLGGVRKQLRQDEQLYSDELTNTTMIIDQPIIDYNDYNYDEYSTDTTTSTSPDTEFDVEAIMGILYTGIMSQRWLHCPVTVNKQYQIRCIYDAVGTLPQQALIMLRDQTYRTQHGYNQFKQLTKYSTRQYAVRYSTIEDIETDDWLNVHELYSGIDMIAEYEQRSQPQKLQLRQHELRELEQRILLLQQDIYYNTDTRSDVNMYAPSPYNVSVQGSIANRLNVLSDIMLGCTERIEHDIKCIDANQST